MDKPNPTSFSEISSQPKSATVGPRLESSDLLEPLAEANPISGSEGAFARVYFPLPSFIGVCVCIDHRGLGNVGNFKAGV